MKGKERKFVTWVSFPSSLISFLSSLFSRESGSVDKQFPFNLREKRTNSFPVLFFAPFFSLLVLLSLLFPQMFSGRKPKYNFRTNQSKVRRSNRERKERITRKNRTEEEEEAGAETTVCIYCLTTRIRDCLFF